MPKMAQEEQRYSNSSSGGGGGGGSRSSKKLKQKKVPQRGLGVAQLEKIRLEEQQKKDIANILPSNAIISPSNSSSCLAIQSTNLRPNLSSTDLTSPNSIFRPPPPPLIPNIDIMRPNLAPLSIPNNVGGISTLDGVNEPKLWNGEYNLERDNHKFDHFGSAFPSNLNLPYESNNPNWPLPSIVQRSQQFQQPSPSSKVNFRSGTSSSSVMNFRTEPPSNQSYHSNNYIPTWPEEERIVGMKRSYPFTIDDAPGPSFSSRFPPAYISPIPRTNESSSCNNDGTFNIEPANPVLREVPSSGVSEPNKQKLIKGNGGFNGDFLTLAPPKSKHSSSFLSCHHSREFLDFDDLPYQGTNGDPVQWPGVSRSVEQPFFSFLPSANTQNGQSSAAISNSNGEVVESIDLSLKL